jgi:virginiamycin B lyase
MLRPSIASLMSVALLALAPAAAQAQSRPSGLPDGAGKEAVERMCVSCHQPNQITESSGYTRDGWNELAATMIDLSSTPADRDAITQYLATHFPPNTRRAAKPVAGDAQIAFKEWTVPTLGQRARDPAQAPDGTIWWAGQWGNLLGSINPATGAMKEYPLPANAKPHTVLIDARGGVWYTGNANATIGKLDPATGKVTEYKMPDPAAKDPHSAIFDRNGIMWFTMQLSNMVGRFDPATGEVKVVAMTVPNSRPYGIKLDSEGVPWFACNGSNCVVRIDPKTMELKVVRLPDEKTTVRRLDFDREGNLWFVNSSQGRIGRYDPKSGEIKEWPSPSGPRSHPYAIAVIDGVIWYNESGVRPDMLVRFDPRTEKFQSWAIPSGGVHAGIVRHMRPTRDGNLLIHQGATNRITLVTLPRRSAAR